MKTIPDNIIIKFEIDYDKEALDELEFRLKKLRDITDDISRNMDNMWRKELE